MADCSLCGGGNAVLLGVLGRRVHVVRCTGCGIDSSTLVGAR